MSNTSNRFVEDFDFTAALKFAPIDRMRRAVERARRRLIDQDALGIFGIPPIPDRGAADAELRDLERAAGVELPAEHAEFLRSWRYLIIDDGLQIWGLDHEGVGIGRPWLSEKHLAGRRHLVFADFWRYADGDQLLFDLDDPDMPVVAYLHEHGPALEYYAPSFSLALWRTTHEGW